MTRFPTVVLAMLLVGCLSHGIPITFAPTPALPPATDAVAFRKAIVTDRNQFLETIRTEIGPFSQQARAARANSGLYTYLAIAIGVAGTIIPQFIHAEGTKTQIAQTSSGLGGALAAAIGFHKFDERASALESCVWHLNSVVVWFGTKWADSSFAASASVADSTWRAYAEDKKAAMAELQGVCPVAGRYVGG